MSPLVISLIAFACIFGATLLGILIRSVLPENQVSSESKDAVKLGVGLIATLAALVLALLIASAKGTFDTMNAGLRKMGAQVILLDRVMAQYGPETMEARELLRHALAASIRQIWPEEKIGGAAAKGEEGSAALQEELRQTPSHIEAVQDKLRQLFPRTEAQRLLQSQALQISGDIAEGRWLLIEQLGQSSFPAVFLVLMVFWLTVIFFTFALFSPPNATVITILLICALSAAGSLFLILELDAPYGGLIKVSSAPLHHALTVLGGLAAGTPK